MRSTAELRILWAPACTAPFARLNLYGEGVVTVDVLIVDAVKALNAVLIDWDYRTRPAEPGAYDQMIRCTACKAFWVYERTDTAPIHPPR